MYIQFITFAEIMIRKLFILGLVLAVCLELSQGKPISQAKVMEDYAESLIQLQGEQIVLHTSGMWKHIIVIVSLILFFLSHTLCYYCRGYQSEF